MACATPGCTRTTLCAECLERDLYHLAGPAMRRGELWAERVIRARRPRDRPWWTWERARGVALEQVAGLGAPDPRAKEALARAAWETAARRWSKPD